MNIDWDQLGEFMAHWRRSGSTTALKEAAKNHGAVLVAHNEEYAKQIGGVSQHRIEHWSRGVQKAPIFFDNGMVIKMIEDFMQTRADLNWMQNIIKDKDFKINQLNGEIRQLKDDVMDRNRTIGWYKVKMGEIRNTLDNYKIIAHMAPRHYLMEKLENVVIAG